VNYAKAFDAFALKHNEKIEQAAKNAHFTENTEVLKRRIVDNYLMQSCPPKPA